MSKRTLRISESFQHGLFFCGSEITYDDRLSDQDLAETPFLLDLLYATDRESFAQGNLSHYIESLFERWQKERPSISSAFKRRDRQEARPLMIQEIGRLIQLIFWINDKRVEGLTQLNADIMHCSIRPVNIEERLSFLMDSPDHYHSFIQLTQLYDELEKKWRVRKKQHMDKN